MNENCFAPLLNIKYVELKNNFCIDESFGGSYSKSLPFSELPKLMSKNCQFSYDSECGKARTIHGLVVGGVLVERGEWPFLVSLQHIESKSHFCGGSLITEKHVVTGDDGR